MKIEYDKGFKIQHVEIFLMEDMKKTSASIAVFETSNGLVVRKNDIPTGVFDVGAGIQKILIGAVLNRKDEDVDALYELPCFQDNLEEGETAYTVMKRSDLTREQVNTLFEKL